MFYYTHTHTHIKIYIYRERIFPFSVINPSICIIGKTFLKLSVVGTYVNLSYQQNYGWFQVNSVLLRDVC